jgi:hypothetical protein
MARPTDKAKRPRGGSRYPPRGNVSLCFNAGSAMLIDSFVFVIDGYGSLVVQHH